MPQNARGPVSALRWLYAAGFWTLIVLLYATRTDIHGQPITPIEALKMSAARWYVWAVLSYVIVAVDRRLPVKEDSLAIRFVAHIPISLFFIGAYTYLNYWFSVLIHAPIDAAVMTANGPLNALGRAFARPSNLVYWVILVTHVVWTFERNKAEREIRTATLERLLSDARLNTLRAQLHPHFLFNSLNTISAHIESNPRAARLMLEHMGDLLRMSLEYHEAQEIPLDQELAFLEKYLELQKMRFEDRLEVKICVDSSALGAFVPTFILQPLVENAVRYGIASRHEKGMIEVEASRSNGSLHLIVRDDGPGLPMGWTLSKSAGIGLSNTRERLAGLYGKGQQGLEVRNAPDGGVRVELTMPFHAAGLYV
jgi:two-component system LytT family sensor kinase